MRYLRHSLAGVLLSALAAAPAAAAEAVAGDVVEDLYYGEVLFQFYKEDYFTALTHAAMAEELKRLPNHTDDVRLLRGGLHLAWGQHAEAAELFSELLADVNDPAVEQRALFFLGKIQFRKGAWAAAEQSLAGPGDALPVAFDAERLSLLTQAQLAQGKRLQAEALVANAWPGPAIWQHYARYNVGVSLLADGNPRGEALLSQVASASGGGAELANLRDRAGLALGYARMAADAGVAGATLNRVRVGGPFSAEALLGAGWAAAETGDYARALTLWQNLGERDLLDPAVQESWLAVPYAQARLYGDAAAVGGYEAAVAAYAEELERLDVAAGGIRNGDLTSRLLADDAAGLDFGSWELSELARDDSNRYLYRVVSTHAFHEGLRNYRELRALDAHLADWEHKLDTFDDMLQTRDVAWAEKLPRVRSAVGDMDVPALQSRHSALLAELDRAEASFDVAALGTADQVAAWERLEGMTASPAFSSDRAADIRAKHRLLSGVLRWDLERDFNYRSWQRRRELESMRADLEAADAGWQQVAGLAAPEQTTGDGFDQRVAELRPRVKSLRNELARQMTMQGEALQATALDVLDAQRQRLETYRAQASFALATAYDRAAMARTAEVTP